MFRSIINNPALQSLSGWLSRLCLPEVATASHEVGRHHHIGSMTSSYVDYGRWPDSARRL
jgi:hypothetical protein